jgi:hypothetical protein
VWPDQLIIAGLACMVELYTSIDGTFVDLWNNVQHHVDLSWLHKTQAGLLRVVPGCAQCTEGQGVEYQVTQYWLRAMFGQLCTPRGLMNRLTGDFISRLCPIRIVEDLETALGGFSPAALDTHGEGVVSLARGLIPCCLCFRFYVYVCCSCLSLRTSCV